ncbi:MAG: DNA polymerase III subunit gamma/tau [Bacteroidales bacterium]|nr:DNA polymerase III subunit gamma/tau [Bacteroidales bacterium]
MADYIVSARKYRPDSFEALIGQDNIARTLKNSVQRGQLAHAYLFCGPRGVGKTSTARIFAKTINCSHPGQDLEPCGECESCLAFQEGRSYNIHELDAASNNSVDDIRTLLEQVQIPPQVGRYSVYIIDEVHMLSAQAFNAFLKTLEEPPAHAVFILCTTEKHKILPTILSRCQTYDFNRITIPDISKNIRAIASAEGVTIDDKSIHVIARKADGAMRDALTLFDQSVAFCGTDIRYEDVIRNLGVLDYEYNFRLVDAFLTGDYATALLLFDEILSKGFNALHFINALSDHLRDLLVARTGGLEALLDQPDSLREQYRGQAMRCSVKFLYDALGVTSDCEAGYKASSNQRLHIEYALMKLAFLVKAPAAEGAPAPQPAAPQPAAAPVPQPAAAPAAAPAPKPAAAPAPKPATAAPKAEEPIEIIVDDDVTAPAQEQPAPEQPAAVKPAPEPAPEQPAAPAPRRRGGAAAKLASLLDETAAPAAAAEAGGPENDRIPSDEEILDHWQNLVDEVSANRPKLKVALAGAALSVSAEGGFKLLTFEVINVAQKAWIEEKLLRDLENRYNAMLGTGRLHLAVSVRPAETVEPKIYMPEEKAQDLMEKNPEVRKLVKDLGLDTK